MCVCVQIEDPAALFIATNNSLDVLYNQAEQVRASYVDHAVRVYHHNSSPSMIGHKQSTCVSMRG